jgi:hypothetical protein
VDVTGGKQRIGHGDSAIREEHGDDRISDRPGGRSSRRDYEEDRIAESLSARQGRLRREEDEDRLNVRMEYPRSVWAAGVIWFIAGVLILVATLVNLVVGMALTSAQAPGAQVVAATPPGGSICALLFGVFMGAVFIHVGEQSVNGTAKDTLGNGVGSMIFAMLNGVWGVLIILFAAAVWRFLSRTAGILLAAIGGLNALSGLALLVAGILALIGRADYKAWRRAQKRSRRDDWGFAGGSEEMR